MTATYITGDVRDTLAAMPDGSVDLVLTSPPFLALRSYLPADHPDKHREIGAEPGPAEFLDTLLGLSAEWRRVLAPHGSLAVELGDTYAGSGGAGGDYAEGGMRENQPKFRAGTPRWDGRPDGQVRTTTSDPVSYPARGGGWPEAKSLTLVPELYRLGLAYGMNPLTGGVSPAGRWRIRNVVRWCRPNPPVGALGDKFRPGTSDMVIACTSAKRWFDLDAVRTEFSNKTNQSSVADTAGAQARAAQGGRPRIGPQVNTHAGAPPLDWWQVSTEAYAGSHYATWPRKLLVRPILAMCPLRVCTVCGEPSRRIVDVASHGEWRRDDLADSSVNHGGPGTHGDRTRMAETLGWTDCECPGGDAKWRPGVVLDPFAGSGTTLAVATGHGRDAIGIDIDQRNVDLARERVGPMFFDDLTLADYIAARAAA